MKIECATVCLCTYNRASRLAETLASLQSMVGPPDCEVELIVVDNNSTDRTSRVVEESARRGPRSVKYLHEARQGKSFALNQALSCARGDVLALTDDDVVVCRDWLLRMVRAFREHDVTFVFGKVLPRWAAVPPPELLTPRAKDVWGPLALVDYGDTPVAYVAESMAQPLPIGANLAFVKSALVRIGGWRTDLGKVNNTLISGEDHEIFMRLRRHGLYSGYYDPEAFVRHYVPESRLTRRYFRRWFFWHGKTQALMLDELFPHLDFARVPRIGGVPRFLWRESIPQAWKYAKAMAQGSALDVLVEELRIVRLLGLYLGCWRLAKRTVDRVASSSKRTAPSPTADGAELAIPTVVRLEGAVSRNTGSASWHPLEEGAEKC